MEARRIIGLDLGIASEHTARVLDEGGRTVAKRRALPTVESLTTLEQAALEGAPPDTALEVVMEPTGPAWLPIAVFFTSRGHRVFRVPSAKAHDMRRYFSRNAKSNTIDADALAKLAILDPGGLRPLVLDTAVQASLDRRVRACDRLTQQVGLAEVPGERGHGQELADQVLDPDLVEADLLREAVAGPHPPVE